MSAGDTVVSLLTPPGVGAIAVIEVRGPRAWELARQLFKPAGKPLPESPELDRFWFGTLGRDEVILAVTGADAVEVHCHGGRRVVRWVIDQFLASGGREPPESRHPSQQAMARQESSLGCGSSLGGLTPPARQDAARLLERALTLRTASFLLDQFHGAFANAVREILSLLDTDPEAARGPLQKLAGFAPVGRHLVEPWKVVVGGPPNVGKSSLVNALAGYQRAVVSEVAGTTRDAVSVRVALDGWPVELIDTAGIRLAENLIEAAGMDVARQEFADADLVLWVMDGGARERQWPGRMVPHERTVYVFNKSDLMPASWGDQPGPRELWWCGDVPAVSALTGDAIDRLAARVVAGVVPNAPAPGDAVPFTPHLAERVEAARTALEGGAPSEAARFLRDALPPV